MQQMIDVKTEKLEGAALDWAVAQVEGRKTRIYLCPIMEEYKVAATVPDGDLESAWMPSIDWAKGGPLIEQNQIVYLRDGDEYVAIISRMESEGIASGSTHLIAACRAIVAAKLGDMVSVPAELMP